MALDPSILFVIYSESKDEILSDTIWNNQRLFFPEDTARRMFDNENPKNREDFKIYSLTELFELYKQGKKTKAIQDVIDAFENF
jgi:hypothetical protein